MVPLDKMVVPEAFHVDSVIVAQASLVNIHVDSIIVIHAFLINLAFFGVV